MTKKKKKDGNCFMDKQSNGQTRQEAKGESYGSKDKAT
jgi:hypothetical protein